jgi:transcriptional regulator with XRE-family HTH domain
MPRSSSVVALRQRSERKPRVQPLDALIGRRVRLRRIALGISQETLAGALELSFQQVQKYEKGRNRIAAARLAQIAACLGVPAAFFFDGQPGSSQDDGPPDPVARCLASTDGLALARAFARIEDPALRRRIIALAEAMAGGASTRLERQGQSSRTTVPLQRLE